VILFGFLPLLTVLGLSPAIERPYRVAILWGGLRGAVTLALALAVTESFRVPEDIQRVVGILATGFTLFTLMVQGTTLRTVIGWLGLDRLSRIDQALSRQVVAVALQTVREDVARTTENYELNRDIVRSEAKRFGDRLDVAVKQAEESADIVDRDRVTLGLIALAGHERDTILMRVRERTISARMTEQVLSDADRLIEGARIQGRSGYQGAARRSVAYGRTFQAAVWLQRRLGLSTPLARMTADRFETLLSQRLILRDLGTFIDGRIRRIHGRRVGELLHELLTRRIETIETALEGLRLQYPGYAEKLQRRFIRRTALRLEEREYTAMREDGLIGAEVYTALMQDLGGRRAAVEARPKLDMALQRTELVRQFPLFTDLGDAALKRLGRALETRYVNFGDVIIRKDTQAKSVFFISSGAVELESAGQTWRFGRGEMFGQLAILMNKTRRAEARAIAPCTLLVLDEARFRRLLARSTALRRRPCAPAPRPAASTRKACCPRDRITRAGAPQERLEKHPGQPCGEKRHRPDQRESDRLHADEGGDAAIDLAGRDFAGSDRAQVEQRESEGRRQETGLQVYGDQHAKPDRVMPEQDQCRCYQRQHDHRDFHEVQKEPEEKN